MTRLGRFNYRNSNEGSIPLLFYHNPGYMNVSGDNLVNPWTRVIQEAEIQGLNAALVVISDELDIDLGKIKIRKQNASARGHNGLKSIQNVIGKGYSSIKIGIGRGSEGGDKSSDLVAKYVLSKFKPSEKEVLNNLVLEQFAKVMKEMTKERYIYDVQR
ncbi:hypothetical protein FOA43_002821 [Brettanomyces nanus]|uniref:peptidyl-tRNA hydrolase n=1 Tax=Eeniella nana TaxID=13502 RepID=A0A875S296_EENNA|nr:uncharacterized protein FOA43_002821 [Brettanomyces nanus]QPG75466.1 hypothetical protein FOA43_002821 [Brettanomyces nanus]